MGPQQHASRLSQGVQVVRVENPHAVDGASPFLKVVQHSEACGFQQCSVCCNCEAWAFTADADACQI
jgi:hypothetical protein